MYVFAYPVYPTYMYLNDYVSLQSLNIARVFVTLLCSFSEHSENLLL